MLRFTIFEACGDEILRECMFGYIGRVFRCWVIEWPNSEVCLSLSSKLVIQQSYMYNTFGYRLPGSDEHVSLSGLLPQQWFTRQWWTCNTVRSPYSSLISTLHWQIYFARQWPLDITYSNHLFWLLQCWLLCLGNYCSMFGSKFVEQLR